MAVSSRPAVEVFQRILPLSTDQKRQEILEQMLVGITTDILRRYIENRRIEAWNSFPQNVKDYVNATTDKIVGRKYIKEIPQERQILCNRFITNFKDAGLNLEKWCELLPGLVEEAFKAQQETTIATQSLLYWSLHAIVDTVRTFFKLDPILKTQYETKINSLLADVGTLKDDIKKLRRQGNDVTDLENKRDAKLLLLVYLGHEDTILDDAHDFKLIVRTKDDKFRQQNQYPFPNSLQMTLRNGNTANFNIPIPFQNEFIVTYYMNELETDPTLKVSFETYCKEGRFLKEVSQVSSQPEKLTNNAGIISGVSSVVSTVVNFFGKASAPASPYTSPTPFQGYPNLAGSGPTHPSGDVNPETNTSSPAPQQ